MCMHSDYIYIVSYNSHGHSVFINGATTVSIEREGISNPMKVQFWSPEAFSNASCLERADSVLERLKKRTSIYLQEKRVR